MSDSENQPTLNERRPSYLDQLKEMSSDQDCKQKMNVTATLVLELYRVLMGSLLLFVVPQNCDGEICTFSQNYNRDDNGVSKSVFTFNLMTLLSFLIMYYNEVKRENKMIDFLHVNAEKARDNESVEEALENLPDDIKQSIWNYDKSYMYSGYFAMGSFSVNAVLSVIVALNNYLDDKTITVLLTNILFMGMKLNDVYTTVHTDKNIFLSAYLTRKIQFNDIDPDAPLKSDDKHDIETNTDSKPSISVSEEETVVS